jgi:translation initiation factor 2-alpha kinase 4
MKTNTTLSLALHLTSRRDFTYDFHTADTSQKILDNPFRTLICDHLTEKFCLRGAVNVESPVLVPYTDIDNPSLVKLLDSEGTVVTLHFDATIPFARTVARDESLIRLKRLDVSPCPTICKILICLASGAVKLLHSSSSGQKMNYA